ncbi:16261_t:CDS:2, partial [Racocetra persica]
TIKFTPHHYYNEPLLKLLKNLNLRQIWTSTNNNNSTFTELVALMVQIKEKRFQDKSLKGLRYSEHPIHFFSLLFESSREYEIFRKAFAGLSIQRI